MVALAGAPPTAGAPTDLDASIAARSPATPLRPPNVLVVVLDCARAKSFRGGGDDPVAHTPAIDALARRGTTFSRAVAPANWTVPSHMSIFTGTYPNVHGLRTFRRGEAPIETMASWLGRRGYETALFTEMVHLVGGYGLESGYSVRRSRREGNADEDRTVVNRLAGHADVLYSPWVRKLLEQMPPFIVPLNLINHPQEVGYKREVCNSYAVEAFADWLGHRSDDRPFHAFFNLVDAHEPYPLIRNGHRIGPLAKWYARTPRYYLLAVPGLSDLVPWPELVAGYRWSIEQADQKIGRIVAALERTGELDRTMIVVTADHGQSFGEGGNVFHGCGATDSITRVPLVVATPEAVDVPVRVDRWTSLCDLFSWAKAASAGREPFGEDGVAPFPFSASAPAPDTVFCEGAPASDPNRSLRGVREDASWNHRLLAAYRGDDKWVADLEGDTLLHWTMHDGDPDGRSPELLRGPRAEAVRLTVFGTYEEIEQRRRATQDSAAAPEGSLDRRLRSWGYD